MNESPNPAPKKARQPSFFDMIISVLASFFGVQTQKNYERDFNANKPWTFIAIAIVLTVLFVLSLIVVVKLMLRNAGL